MNDPEERDIARLVQAAMESPSRPMRPEQIRQVVERARQLDPWAVRLLAAGLVLLAVLAGIGMTLPEDSDLRVAFTLVPLANLVLAPIAAVILIVIRRKSHA